MVFVAVAAIAAGAVAFVFLLLLARAVEILNIPAALLKELLSLSNRYRKCMYRHISCEQYSLMYGFYI